MINAMANRFWACHLTLAAISIVGIQTERTWGQADAEAHLQLVRGYADAMIDRGRDQYGAIHSPLFAATLDLKTLGLPVTKPARIEGIRANDRTLTGANPMHDQNLYQVLYALTRITGDTRYAEAADTTLTWFVRHCQNPTTGLLAFWRTLYGRGAIRLLTVPPCFARSADELLLPRGVVEADAD